MQRIIPKVEPKYLLLIAGCVWLLAGGNIFKIGIVDFVRNWNMNYLFLAEAVAVFLIFMSCIFYRLVQKHTKRIMQIEEPKVPFYLFFDRKSYLIMIFMITGGLLLRMSQILPEIVIGVLYTGIGFSLIGAGVLFLQKFAVALLKKAV